MLTFILFVAGLVLLVVGARLLVGGASALATTMGVSPLVIGLTVVAFGTSSPELAVTIQSSLSGQDGVGVGNVVGSSVFNVLFILGLSALIAPLVVSEELLKRDGPVMVVAAILLFILALDHQLSRLDGSILAILLVGYIAYLIRQGREEEQEDDSENDTPPAAWPLQLGRVAVGLVFLVLGSTWLVDGAVELAEVIGLSEVVVGLTIVAAGTGLPEVAASVLATMRGERYLAVGSVVGSNIFNVLAVLGVAAVVSPDGLAVPQAASAFDIPIAIAVTFACLLSFVTGYRVERWEGALFLGYYATYTVYLVLEATDSGIFPAFRIAAIVLAVAGLALLLVRAIRVHTTGKSAPA